MRFLSLVVAMSLLACGSEVERPARLDAVQLTGLAHAWLGAYVNSDADELAGLLADGFVSFDADLIQERSELLDMLRWRRDHGQRPPAPTYREQRAWLGEAAEIYSGHVIEQSAPGDTTPSRDGWYTLVFTPGEAERLAGYGGRCQRRRLATGS
jgi:hypothetical protein